MDIADNQDDVEPRLGDDRHQLSQAGMGRRMAFALNLDGDFAIEPGLGRAQFRLIVEAGIAGVLLPQALPHFGDCLNARAVGRPHPQDDLRYDASLVLRCVVWPMASHL